MKRFLSYIALTVLLCNVVQGCVIEKRRYLRGYHVTTDIRTNFFSNQNATEKDKNEQVAEQDLEIETVVDLPLIDTISDKSLGASPIASQLPVEMRPANKLENGIIQRSREPISTVIRTMLQATPVHYKAGVDEEPESEKRWFPTLIGILLGVLLALVALPFLFILLCILLDGDLDDSFQFSEKAADGSLKKGFKRAYNGVTRVGLTVLWIASIIIVLTLAVIGLYLSLGLLGAILAIIILIILFFLLVKLMEGFLAFILPDY